jgi:hypothetical protein
MCQADARLAQSRFSHNMLGQPLLSTARNMVGATSQPQASEDYSIVFIINDKA